MPYMRARLRHPLYRPMGTEPPKPFLKTPEGKRITIFGFGFAALIATLLSGVKHPSAQETRQTDSQPTSRPVTVLAHPPATFIPASVLHVIRAVQDETEEPSEAARAAVLKWLYPTAGPESGPTELPPTLNPTELAIDEARAFPDAFRGGHVRTRGQVIRVRTYDSDRVPGERIYRGYLVQDPRAAGVMFDTINPLPGDKFEKLDPIEIEGVFVQNIRYEAVNGKFQTVPYIVATSMRVARPETPHSLWQNPLVLLMMVAIVLFGLAAWLIIQRRLRRDIPPPGFRARRPGPGR